MINKYYAFPNKTKDARVLVSPNSLFFFFLFRLMLNMRLLYNKQWLVYVILSPQVWTAFGLVALSSGRLATQAIAYIAHSSLYYKLLTCATEPWTSSVATKFTQLWSCSQAFTHLFSSSTYTNYMQHWNWTCGTVSDCHSPAGWAF